MNEEGKLGELYITLQSKIELWLVNRNKKPAATISFLQNSAHDLINLHETDVKKLKDWLKLHKIYVIQDKIDPILFHISKKEEDVETLNEIIFKEDIENTYKKGVLFGYPLGAVKIYSKNIDLLRQSVQNYSLLNLINGNSPEIKSFPHYWKPYIRYITRRDKLYDDSLVAKTWADTIRAEITTIAQEFEQMIENSLIK